ncbi:MAG TPA: PhzF family phenazine biosynthesis protein [Polyangiaceae bacterium]|nr:PhzF family phenazine biosynthesis protein [Polyangiaceae bacterium]
MGQSIVVVDAFADQPFTGNPAAVCLLSEAADERWMQLVAREMNLSETAFLYREGRGFRLRWFTPTAEIDLCGHATLASAHVLWETGQLSAADPAHFETRSGALSARQEGQLIALDFPALFATECEPFSGLVDAIGAPVRYVGRTEFDLIVELENEAAVRGLRPDLARIATFPVRGVIVTSRSQDPAFDFVSRFFAPAFGVPEDPVTGSAHCCLGPFWGERLGKRDLTGYQASVRGGSVQVGVRGDRVRLGGRAITTLRGTLSA